MTEEGRQRAEDGRQMTDDRGQKTDDRGQKTDDRGRKTENWKLECGLRPLRAVGSIYEPEAVGAYAPEGSRKEGIFYVCLNYLNL